MLVDILKDTCWRSSVSWLTEAWIYKILPFYLAMLIHIGEEDRFESFGYMLYDFQDVKNSCMFN